MELPPKRVETRRLVLRPCRPAEAPLLREAIDSSLDHLRAWMRWAMSEPSSLEETRERINTSLNRFEKGEDFAYCIFPRSEEAVFGGIGLHRRAGPDCLEIGYWMGAGQVGLGYGTEAVTALAAVGLELAGIGRIKIECDPANQASVRVAQKAGFSLVERRSGDKLTPSGEPRDTLVFEVRSVEAVPDT